MNVQAFRYKKKVIMPKNTSLFRRDKRWLVKFKFLHGFFLVNKGKAVKLT